MSTGGKRRCRGFGMMRVGETEVVSFHGLSSVRAEGRAAGSTTEV